jgi:hypothetical protein
MFTKQKRNPSWPRDSSRGEWGLKKEKIYKECQEKD